VSYAINYVLSVGALALISGFISNPYLSGFLSAFIVSIANFFALKFVVFRNGVS